jgi:hypothetical protein
MSKRHVGSALVVWTLLLLALALGWKMAFSPVPWLRTFGTFAWVVTAVAFGGWFIWIQKMSDRDSAARLCDNCEGKKHRK